MSSETVDGWVIEGEGADAQMKMRQACIYFDGDDCLVVEDQDGTAAYVERPALLAFLRAAGLLPAGLPEEVPEGHVRCRAAVVVSQSGSYDVQGAQGETDGEMRHWVERFIVDRIGESEAREFAFVVFDRPIPKPEPPAEVVGVVVTDAD